MKRRVLILGAGVYQVPLIRRAGRMGLETLVASIPGPYPGIDLADRFVEVDITDADSVLRTAKENGVAAIVTSGSDVSIPALALATSEIGLIGPSPRASETVSRKTAFRGFQQRHGFNCPRFSRCGTVEDALSFRRSATGRIVVKPDDASGSRGVRVLPGQADERDVARAYEAARGFSRNGLVCAEGFIEGVEVGGDGFLSDGVFTYFTTTRKHLDDVLVRGHSLPGMLDDADTERVKTELAGLCREMGYLDGPLNFDVMVAPDRVTAVEIGVRNGGNGITDLIRWCHGVDLMQWLLDYALGEPVDRRVDMTDTPMSSYVFGSLRAGILRHVADLDTLRGVVPEVVQLTLARQEGDPVEPFTHNANLVGYAVFRGEPERYTDLAKRIDETLELEVE